MHTARFPLIFLRFGLKKIFQDSIWISRFFDRGKNRRLFVNNVENRAKFKLGLNNFKSIAHVEQIFKVVKNIRLVALLHSYVAAVAKVGRKNQKNRPTLATVATLERSSAIKRKVNKTIFWLFNMSYWDLKNPKCSHFWRLPPSGVGLSSITL